MIRLLGQHRRFEVLDFAYHLQRINKVDGEKITIEHYDLSQSAERMRRIQMLNNQIFATIGVYASDWDEQKIESVREFVPPMHPSMTEHYDD
ncbi:unnamed protein product, partial [Mesorhabditis spiculigera]